MKFSEIYYRVLNWPDQTALAVAVGLAVLLVIVGLLISFGRYRSLSRSLSVLGLVLIMLVLFAVRQQTVTTKVSAVVTATRPRYSERAGFTPSAGLLGVPLGDRGGDVFGIPGDPAPAPGPGSPPSQSGSQAFRPEGIRGRAPRVQPSHPGRTPSGRGLLPAGLRLSSDGPARVLLWPISTVPSSAIRRLASAYLERGKISHRNMATSTRALADFQQLMTIRANDPEFYLEPGNLPDEEGSVERRGRRF